MNARYRMRTQVAGVLDSAEVELLLEAGVDDIGIPFGPGIVTPELDALKLSAVLRSTSDLTPFVWITYATSASEVIDGLGSFGFGKVQLHGPIEASEVEKLRRARPELWISKAFAVGRIPVNMLFPELAQYGPFVDWFFLDTYDRQTGHIGATGKTHDWSHSARIVDASVLPVMLAGGLTPDNVAAAIEQVSPAGVDAHTGLENAEGRKVPEKVRQFVRRAQQGSIRKYSR